MAAPQEENSGDGSRANGSALEHVGVASLPCSCASGGRAAASGKEAKGAAPACISSFQTAAEAAEQAGSMTTVNCGATQEISDLK